MLGAPFVPHSEPSTVASLLHRVLAEDLNLNLQQVFMNALNSLGSEEQIAKWGPLCRNYQIIITYAQTELGHGEQGLLHVVSRLCTVQPQGIHSHLRFAGLYFQIHIFKMKACQQMAVKGLVEGVAFSNLCKTYCVRILSSVWKNEINKVYFEVNKIIAIHAQLFHKMHSSCTFHGLKNISVPR